MRVPLLPVLWRLLLVCLVLAVVATDASAGPILKRLRERRADRQGSTCGPCQSGPALPDPGLSPAPNVFRAIPSASVPAAGCANGQCPTPQRFVLPRR